MFGTSYNRGKASPVEMPRLCCNTHKLSCSALSQQQPIVNIISSYQAGRVDQAALALAACRLQPGPQPYRAPPPAWPRRLRCHALDVTRSDCSGKAAAPLLSGRDLSALARQRRRCRSSSVGTGKAAADCRLLSAPCASCCLLVGLLLVVSLLARCASCCPLEGPLVGGVRMGCSGCPRPCAQPRQWARPCRRRHRLCTLCSRCSCSWGSQTRPRQTTSCRSTLPGLCPRIAGIPCQARPAQHLQLVSASSPGMVDKRVPVAETRSDVATVTWQASPQARPPQAQARLNLQDSTFTYNNTFKETQRERHVALAQQAGAQPGRVNAERVWLAVLGTEPSLQAHASQTALI